MSILGRRNILYEDVVKELTYVQDRNGNVYPSHEEYISRRNKAATDMRIY